MKKNIILVSFFLIVFLSSNSSEIKNNKEKKEISKSEVRKSILKVKEFLLWYKLNYDKINQIKLINYNTENPSDYYTVNIENSEKFLDLLIKSNFFSEYYTVNQKKSFKEKNENLKKIKQNDGPPEGFNYDLILITQEVYYYLYNIEKLIFVEEKKENNTIVKINNELLIRLNNNMKIDSIYR